MKILGSVESIRINPVAAAALKINEDVSFFAIPNSVLDKFNAKKFDIINSNNELMLVAQPAKAELTNDKNKPTVSKRILS